MKIAIVRHHHTHDRCIRECCLHANAVVYPGKKRVHPRQQNVRADSAAFNSLEAYTAHALKLKQIHLGKMKFMALLFTL